MSKASHNAILNSVLNVAMNYLAACSESRDEFNKLVNMTAGAMTTGKDDYWFSFLDVWTLKQGTPGKQSR